MIGAGTDQNAISDARLLDELTAAVDMAVFDFLAESGWDGGCYGRTNFWVAPRAWTSLTTVGTGLAAKFMFALSSAAEGGDDATSPPAPTATGMRPAVLAWQREPCGSATAFAKFVAKQGQVVTDLITLGFVRVPRGGFVLPFAFEMAVVRQGLRDGDLEPAVQPLAAALRIAHVAAPLFTPLIDWIKDKLDR